MGMMLDWSDNLVGSGLVRLPDVPLPRRRFEVSRVVLRLIEGLLQSGFGGREEHSSTQVSYWIATTQPYFSPITVAATAKLVPLPPHEIG